MLSTADFFEAQIKQCADLASRSTNKNAREFWVKMAHRWQALLEARQLNGAQTGYRLRFQRVRFAKRRRAA